MSFNGLRRAANAVLATVAIAVVAAVLVDLFGVGPRRQDNAAIAVTLISNPPLTTLPLAEVIAKVQTETVKAPARVCPASTVMPFGDSLTAGWEGYRGPLFRALDARRIPADFVGSGKIDPMGGGDPDVEAHPGFSFGPDLRVDENGAPKNFSANIDKWFALKPSIAIIVLGSEELFEPSTRANTAAAFEGLIEQIRKKSPGTLLVLTELPPSKRFPANDPALLALNNKMKQLAAVERNDLVYFAAVNQKLKQLKFDPLKDLTEDQFRFTQSGGKKFAIALEPFISGAIVRDRSRRCVAVRQASTTTTTPPTTLPTTSTESPDLFDNTDDLIAEDSGFVTETP
jgi:hypothetical protein